MPILSTIGAISSKAWGFARAVVAVADPLWNYVSLLLSSTTPSGGSTINSDASTNNFLLTPSGVPYNSVTNPFQAGYYSNFFGGTGNYLQTSTVTAIPITQSTFTVEAWVYMTATPVGTYGAVIGDMQATISGSNYWSFGVNSSNQIAFYWYSGTGNNVTGSTTMSLNTWYHIAISVNTNTISMYVNGVAQTLTGTTTLSNRSGTLTYLVSGQYNGATSGLFTGYISNLRVVSGTAVYTAAFTPPTVPLTAISGTTLLTCQTNRFQDTSTNALTLTATGSPKISQNQPFTYTTPTTYASEFFNGSTDYITAPNNVQLVSGTGDFTLEFWAYPTNVSATQTIVEIGRPSNGATPGFQIDIISGVVYAYYGATIASSITGPSVSNNTWYYLALTRASGNLRLFVNGVQAGSTATDNTNYSQGYSWIGANPGGASSFSGYISNVRVVKGTAVYTANFTPPTAPLTAITNTSLLSLQNNIPGTNNGFVDSSALLNPITRTGTPTQGSFAPFGTLWSNYFNGSTDYLTTPANTAFAFGTGDFTIECWVYTNSSATQRIVSAGNAGGTPYEFVLVNTGSNVYVDFFDGTTDNTTGSNYVTQNQWVHLAVTRQGTALKLFINGVVSGSATNSVNLTAAGTLTIGRYGQAASGYFSGYISNLRIIKGTAVYTAAFTPPTAPLTAISGTSLLTCQTNRFQDTSTNAFTLTATGAPKVQTFNPFLPTTVYSTAVQGGSAYFNGTTDYLTLNNSTNLNPGTGNFTFECWIYLTTSSFYSGAQSPSILEGKQNGLSVGFNTSGQLAIAQSFVGFLITDTVVFPISQWVHVVAVRSGTTLSLFKNGVRVATTSSNSTNFVTNTINYVGSGGTTSFSYIPGYISNIRLVVGSAVYDPTLTTLTVPTAPLAPITNTALLLNTANAGSIDYSANNDLVTVTNATVSTNVVKYGTGSLYFNGSSSMTIPSSTAINFNTGNFTVEFWIYILTVPSANTNGVFCINGSTPLFINFRNSGTLALTDASTVFATTASPLVANNWYHIAVVRNSGTSYVYTNGVAGTGVACSDNFTQGAVTIGTGQGTSATYYFNGYLSDLRVTNGVARYTSNFTPPTAALPNY